MSAKNLPSTRLQHEHTLAILQEEGASAVDGRRPRGVFHCFTETQAVARAALDLGFDISFSGILTFKTAHELREVARFVPLDRCLIETDSPYLAPMPHRGKTNTPAYVPLVAQQIALGWCVYPNPVGDVYSGALISFSTCRSNLI